jgi:uncharacterized RDD family membrane protein YckC
MNQYAKFGTRLACHFGDVLIIQIIVIPIILIAQLNNYRLDASLITLVIWGIYSTIMNSSISRGTYGKKLLGVKVETDEGERLSVIQSAVRFVLGFLLFGMVVGMIPIFFNKRKKGIHDIMIGSVVKYRN